MFKRLLATPIEEALSDTPVLLLNGARQTGKSTLCNQLIDDGVFKGTLVTLDDTTTLNAARLNPMAFLEDMDQHLIIDEVQRAPELFLSIKKLVDKDRKTRRFILTGSSDVMTLPKVADSLAGRIEIFNLWPLSQNELNATTSHFLTNLVSANGKFATMTTQWKDILQMIVTGGYPEAVLRETTQRRSRWFSSYLTSILQKDIRELAHIEGLTQIPQVLQLIATRISSTINLSEIARLSGIKNTTLQRYVALLQQIFLIIKIPAWTPNTEGQFVKSPKIYLNDTGLLSHLRGENDKDLNVSRKDAGAYLENFIVMEILKQISWSSQSFTPYHFSIHKGSEVDLVLANQKSQLYGIEIKSAASLNESDFQGLRKLALLCGSKFQKGIILYTGEKTIPFGDNLYAVPVSAVWA